MKDNHHITQNQTVKININNSGNKSNRKRSKPHPAFGGGGGGGGFGGGFSIPPIIHNDNRPDISNLENSLDKQEDALNRIYSNQMIQHTYSNYIKDGYAHHPQIEASHPTYMIGDKGHLPYYETRIEELPDDKEEDHGFRLRGDESPISPMGSLTSAKSYIPPQPETPFEPTLKLAGRHRKEANNMGQKGDKMRIKREVELLQRLPKNERDKVVNNIKADG